MKARLKWWHVGIFLILLVACLSPLASSSPDGLERIAEDKGFIEEAQDAPYQVIGDYVFPWIENEALATILAGIVGVVIVLVLAYGVSRLLRAANRGSQ